MTSSKPRPPLIPGETRAYPVLPLRDIVVFPHTIAPVHSEFLNYAAIGMAATRSGQGRHGRAAVGQIVLPECCH